MFCSFFSDDMYIFNVHPCKILTEISLRLVRSHRDWWGLVEIAEILSWCLGLLQTLASATRLSTSCRDWWDLTEIAEISPRLQRSCHDLGGLTRSWQDFPTSHKYCLNTPILFVLFTKEFALSELRSTLWMHLHILSVFCNQRPCNRYCRFYLTVL